MLIILQALTRIHIKDKVLTLGISILKSCFFILFQLTLESYFEDLSIFSK